MRHEPVVILAVLLSSMTVCHCLFKIKKDNRDVDVFNLLLELYKLNPLQQSEVYKKFYKKVLSKTEHETPVPPDGWSMTPDDDINTKIEHKLEDIENTIHTPQVSHVNRRKYEIPAYAIGGDKSEKFDIGVVVAHYRENKEKKEKSRIFTEGSNMSDDSGSSENETSTMPDTLAIDLPTTARIEDREEEWMYKNGENKNVNDKIVNIDNNALLPIGGNEQDKIINVDNYELIPIENKHGNDKVVNIDNNALTPIGNEIKVNKGADPEVVLL